MTDIESLQAEANRLIRQEPVPLLEIRKKIVEMDELINSPEYQSLDREQRSQVQNLYKELRARMRASEGSVQGAGAMAGAFAGEPGLAFSSGAMKERSGSPVIQHNPQAELTMQEAEKLFYGGRYAEAIKLYDQVLGIEPDWDRARQHRSESENYLRTGYIPSVALPAEAATAFGKAQSAARLGRYLEAMTLLTRAHSTLREMGIQRWQEGQEFEQKLQQNIDAESVYDEGVKLFAKGQFEEGIGQMFDYALNKASEVFGNAGRSLTRLEDKLLYTGERYLANRNHALSRLETAVRHLDPENTLARGFAMVMKNDRILTDPTMILPGDELNIRLKSSVITTKVKTNNEINP